MNQCADPLPTRCREPRHSSAQSQGFRRKGDRTRPPGVSSGHHGVATVARMSTSSTPIDLGRPVQGDVIDLILDDHRRFESLMRQLRDSTSDRDAVRKALAALHVAHAEAEEKHVYPKLRRKDAITEHEAEHGEEEHAEGHEAMLKVLELAGTDTQAFDDAVEELATALNHHLTEEELTILNPAREEVGEQVRAELGVAFATERNQQLDDDCGAIDNVRRIVEAAEKKGLLDEDDEESED